MKRQIVFVGFWMALAVSSVLRAQGVNGQFQTVDKHKNNTVRVDPGVEWAAYGSIVPMPAVYDPSKRGRKLTEKQEEKVRAAVDTSLEATFPQAANRAGRVLEVRPVITEVRRVLPWVNALSFAAVQAPVSYGGASVRYDLYDAETGVQVGEIVSKRCAGPFNIYPWQLLQAFQPVGHASTILKRDSKMLRKDLTRIEGVQSAR
jgi:hypothetical protein